MRQLELVFLIAISARLLAQDGIRAGTVLPVQLNSTLRSDKAKAGDKVTGRIMQDVPLPGGEKIRSGAKMLGHIVSAKAAGSGREAEISVRFDTLVSGKRRVAMITNLRALATMMDVSEAPVPESGPDRGTSEILWTTDQIGGEVVYRGAGVTHGSIIVGKSVLDSGVLVQVRSNPKKKCRGAVAGNYEMQALWVFSSDACGLYDLPNLRLAHAGRSDPAGEIQLLSEKGEVKVRAGSGMLLRVDGTAP